MLDVMLESYKINKACFHNVVLLYVRASGGCDVNRSDSCLNAEH